GGQVRPERTDDGARVEANYRERAGRNRTAGVVTADARTRRRPRIVLGHHRSGVAIPCCRRVSIAAGEYGDGDFPDGLARLAGVEEEGSDEGIRARFAEQMSARVVG